LPARVAAQKNLLVRVAATRRFVVSCRPRLRDRTVRVWRVIKRAVRAALPPAVFLALVAYFGWNATQGERGLLAYAQRQKLLVTAQGDEAKAEADRDAWERRLAGMSAAHVDPDALDEKARQMLNLSDPNDILVPYPPSKKLF
jgi:cell division protein FtsB